MAKETLHRSGFTLCGSSRGNEVKASAESSRVAMETSVIACDRPEELAVENYSSAILGKKCNRDLGVGQQNE